MGRRLVCNGDGLPGRCVFCGDANLTEAMVLPDWLDFVQTGSAMDCLERATGTNLREPLSRSPRLACAACNDGWIAGLHARVRPFVVSAVQGKPTELSAEQVRALAGWLCLLAFNVAFLTHHCGISSGDRAHLRHTGLPPKNWSIYAAGLSGPGWSLACQHRPYRIEFAGNPMTTPSRDRPIHDSNTQLLSFGMGSVFFHIFSSPSHLLMNDFNASARDQGLTQIWPAPRRFGLLSQRAVRLPADLRLTDAQADAIASAFAKRLQCCRQHLQNEPAISSAA